MKYNSPQAAAHEGPCPDADNQVQADKTCAETAESNELHKSLQINKAASVGS